MKTTRFVSTLVVLISVLLAVTSCGQRKTVTVPDVRDRGVLPAYDALHDAGLDVSTRVSLSYYRQLLPPHYIVIGLSDLAGPGYRAPTVVWQKPRPGGTVARGSTVTIGLSDRSAGSNEELRCDSQPEAAANLIGETLSEALRYQRHCLAFSVAKIPPLEAGTHGHLFDNYVVVRQSPAPGALFLPISASNPPGNTTLTVEVIRR